MSRNAEMRRSAASSPSCSDICWNPDLAMIDLDDDDLDDDDLDDGDDDDDDDDDDDIVDGFARCYRFLHDASED